MTRAYVRRLLANLLHGPWIADDPAPAASLLDRRDGLTDSRDRASRVMGEEAGRPIPAAGFPST